MAAHFHRGFLIVLTIMVGALNSGCRIAANDTSGSPSQGGGSGGSGGPSGQTPKVATLAFETLSTSSLYTSDAGTNNCATFTLTAKTKDNTVAAGAIVTVSIVGVATAELAEYGTLTSSLTIDENGQGSGNFCAAKKVASIILVAQADGVQVNSGAINIEIMPEYSLSYRDSDFDSNTSKPKDSILANLFDSGPYDCGNLYFRLTKLDSPVKDASVKFKSDFGYPAGAKLRPRSSTDTPYETDTLTQKKYLSYSATSDTDGIFSIPFCSGQVPGSMIVMGSYTDEYGKSHTVKSPPISISSGTANLTTLALEFNTTNARTLKAIFNNEIPSPLDLIVKISSVFGGGLSVFNPVYVHSESGTLNVESGGVPDQNGTTKFSMLASYNGSARPTPVRLFNDARAQSTCNPEAIAKEYAGTATTAFNYSDLAINWRTTLVYAMRGQESFNDANRNGKYDLGGDGFWDKDHDGVYTQGVDAVTYFGSIPGGAACRCLDASGAPLATAPTQGAQTTPCIETTTQASCFRRTSEWFIDLPTPFVDANENGIYESTVNGQDMDRLIGDTYDAPNSKRDVDTLIWKSAYLPIYTGTSPYAMVRSAIKSGTTLEPHNNPHTLETAGVYSYYSDLVTRQLMNSQVQNFLDHAQINLESSNMRNNGSGSYSAYRWFTAHGICGTPAPGGTVVSASPELISEPYGDRLLTTHFYIQPGDQILDPSRRLLKNGIGASSSEINFNVPDHASAAAGYPVIYEVNVAPCKRAVPNGTGLWCAPASHYIHTRLDTDTVTLQVSIPEYKHAVTCKAGYSENSATGSCEN
jgi:hypothetical protein